MVINSPGGLPAQSDIICTKLKNFVNQHHLPLYTFAVGMAASGGYYILCIGDRVYVDEISLVGSIGVVGKWFGMKKIIHNWGIENRKFTTNKYYSLYFHLY